MDCRVQSVFLGAHGNSSECTGARALVQVAQLEEGDEAALDEIDQLAEGEGAAAAAAERADVFAARLAALLIPWLGLHSR